MLLYKAIIAVIVTILANGAISDAVYATQRLSFAYQQLNVVNYGNDNLTFVSGSALQIATSICEAERRYCGDFGLAKRAEVISVVSEMAPTIDAKTYALHSTFHYSLGVSANIGAIAGQKNFFFSPVVYTRAIFGSVKTEHTSEVANDPLTQNNAGTTKGYSYGVSFETTLPWNTFFEIGLNQSHLVVNLRQVNLVESTSALQFGIGYRPGRR